MYAFAQPHKGLIAELFFFYAYSVFNQIKLIYKDDYNSNISLSAFGLDILFMLLVTSAKVFKILFFASGGWREEQDGTWWSRW